MRHLMVQALREESGQDLIEYALLASSISVIAIVAVVSVGNSIAVLWNAVAAKMPSL
jgi:Flp pilus assembly pilin Flp